METISKKRRSIIWKVSSDVFKEKINEAKTLKDVLESFGLPAESGGNYDTLRERIAEEKVDISHIEKSRKELFLKNVNKKVSLEEILVKNSTFSRKSLKKRLFEEGLLTNKCYECGNGPEWQGEPISLQLEHKNGINNDHRLENLTILCPNCHSQTKTYAGKNNKNKKNNKPKCKGCLNPTTSLVTGLCRDCYNVAQQTTKRPSKEELKQLISTYPFTELAKKFNVSDNAIRKWCKVYELPYRKTKLKNC